MLTTAGVPPVAWRLITAAFSTSQTQPFAEFLHGIHRGDEQAAIELVRRCEPLMRREAGLGISDGRLNRAFDSVGVCQSELASFSGMPICRMDLAGRN